MLYKSRSPSSILGKTSVRMSEWLRSWPQDPMRKLRGSNPLPHIASQTHFACVAQMVEHLSCKEKVLGSIPSEGKPLFLVMSYIPGKNG